VITLVLGGAASGKSAVAERLIGRCASPITYVATGVVTDDDMAARIARHRQRRPSAWDLVEATRGDLAGSIRAVAGSVIIDALGTWVASFGDERIDDSMVTALCDALAARDGDSVVVSDEVGLGVHPSTEVGRRFRDDLGRVNQAVAAVADDVLLVVAGRVLPLATV
jgi:adenosyl cobinamide kinase/adenosyl cobinamide phosphate guanylyltransferase